MIDFTSALYLGMRHPHRSLRPWTELTTGRPAALESPQEVEHLARQLARLLGCERATLGTSTLHLFWDLFEVLARDRIRIYTDAGAYPIARWGIERVAARGVETTDFQSHDPAALEGLLDQDSGSGFRPVVVTDGLCPGNGRAAPLPEYLRLVQAHSGYLVVDDTQALGILGHGPGPNVPYGAGGAGTPAWYGIDGSELVVASSLAKGFGAPLAVLAGNAELISRFERLSSIRTHSSPPSLASISAGERALALNASEGDYLRRRLLRLVHQFREHLRQLGLSSSGGIFPVQTLNPIPGLGMRRLHSGLLARGVKTVLRRARNGWEARLSFLITTLHTPADIGGGITAVQTARALAPGRRQSSLIET